AVDSQPGEGSDFHFTATFARAADRAERESADPSQLAGVAVLVVDDNAANRLVCEEMLSGWGMKAKAVDSGRHALQEFDQAAAAGQPYQLALIDVTMPGMDGFEMIRQLRQRPEAEALPIIILSTAIRAEDQRQAEEQHAACCLTKPITQSQLLEGVASALGTAHTDVAAADDLTADRPTQFLPRRVLLAEDGMVNRRVATRLLEKRGHVVTAVENGQLAIEAVQQGDFDLILMDIQMPVLDGLAATAAIRKQETNHDHPLPIIAITAHAMKGDRQRCLAAGMDDYVSKPFRPQELFAAVERIESAGARAAAGRPQPSASADPPHEAVAADDDRDAHPFDVDQALENFGGDDKALSDAIGMFAVEGPKQMAQIEAAYASGDSAAVMRAAHLFKGSVALFGAETATAAARRIEVIGREDRLDQFDAAWSELKLSVERLRQAMRFVSS
ncbi:MAG: response regulator, partial [Planctomycetota bacterium]